MLYGMEEFDDEFGLIKKEKLNITEKQEVKTIQGEWKKNYTINPNIINSKYLDIIYLHS